MDRSTRSSRRKACGSCARQRGRLGRTRSRNAGFAPRAGSVWTKASFTANDISSPPWASTSSIITGIGLTRPDDSFPRQSTRPHHRSRILPGRGYTDGRSSMDSSASIPTRHSRTRFTGGTRRDLPRGPRRAGCVGVASRAAACEQSGRGRSQPAQTPAQTDARVTDRSDSAGDHLGSASVTTSDGGTTARRP